MKITVRGESVKMDPEARALIIAALNDAAQGWLGAAASTASGKDQDRILSEVGNVKAFAMMLEPKSEDE